MISNKGTRPYTVVPGDVVRNARGHERIVRGVSQDASTGLTTHVTFAIMRKSWTNRPYTVLNYADLANYGYVPTGVRITEMTLLDKMLNTDIIKNRKKAFSCRLKARDVAGILR